MKNQYYHAPLLILLHSSETGTERPSELLAIKYSVNELAQINILITLQQLLPEKTESEPEEYLYLPRPDVLHYDITEEQLTTGNRKLGFCQLQSCNLIFFGISPWLS